jgi:hypothetical protein
MEVGRVWRRAAATTVDGGEYVQLDAVGRRDSSKYEMTPRGMRGKSRSSEAARVVLLGKPNQLRNLTTTTDMHVFAATVTATTTAYARRPKATLGRIGKNSGHVIVVDGREQ